MIVPCIESVRRSTAEQIAPTTLLTGPETVPLASRTGADKIEPLVRRAEIVHVHTLWSQLSVAIWHACREHDKPHAARHARSILVVGQGVEEIEPIVSSA